MERLNAGESVQCLVEEESLLATVFYVVQSWYARTQDSGVETKGTHAFIMQFSVLDLCTSPLPPHPQDGFLYVIT